jgi:carboxymethylenebutenolidase
MQTFAAGRRTVHMERFQPSSPGPHPAAMVLHGADGLPGRGLPYRELATRLAAHGYLTFLPHYFDATDSDIRPNPLDPVNFAAWLKAIGKAIGHALSQPDVREERIALVGFSLGGYLSVAVASEDARVAAVIECCGGVPGFFVRNMDTMPPLLILHGSADPVVPVSEAYKLQRLLEQHGRPLEVWIYPGRGHQLAGADIEDALRRTASFLQRHLKSQAA